MFYIFLEVNQHRGCAVNVNAARWNHIFCCMQSAARDDLWTASGPPNCDISKSCVAVDIVTP